MKRHRSLDELKDHFLSNVSHEFRSPLASLIGYLDLMKRDSAGFSEKHREYLQTMRSSASRLKRFVDNIIDLTKLDARFMEFVPEPVEVRPLLEWCVKAHENAISAQALEIHVECSPQLCVTADPELVKKILDQIFINAVHFTPDGGKITLWAKDGGQKSILMGVSDSGVGIPRQQFERIFEKFEQVAETKDVLRKTHGTGLGLTVARRLVESQGGRLWLEASSKNGSTFAWVLPKPTRVSSKNSSGKTDKVVHAPRAGKSR